MIPQSIIVDGMRWHMSPAGQAQLAAGDLRLAEHIATGRAVVVKHGGHRTVYRVPLSSGVIYWKHCRLNGPRAWWRDVFRGPKARLEFERLSELALRGIATIEPLAWGQFASRWPKGSVLITRALDDAVALDNYLLLNTSEMPGHWRMLNRALADFVRRLHAAGVVHQDLHPGNILVREVADSWQFYLIDVHDVKLGGPLSRGQRIANLTLFNRWFQLRVGRTDRLRFWRAYAGTGWSRADAVEIEMRTDRSVVELWASRDTRCLHENRHFRRSGGRGVSGFAMRELDSKFEAELMANPDAPFDRPDVRLVKDSRSATVCFIEVPTTTGPHEMVYKRFRATHWTDPFANLFRSSPALRSWRNGHALLDRGLPTPLPRLVLHRRKFGLCTVGYLLCDRVQEARHLHEVIVASPVNDKRRLAERLARSIRIMHERGVCHRDLKAANILVNRWGECYFIDLVGVRTRRVVPRRIRVRDLARLNASFATSTHISRSDRLRFLRIYLLWALSGRRDWKNWWKEIAEATEEKIERNRRRNRPLA
jgi:serine/threonine protein kinase